MALAKGLEEELTCPIHLEYYEEPMVLKCLHSLCKNDVEIMTKEKGQLECPLCKTVSKLKDIKPDFRTQKLIDVLQENIPLESDISKKAVPSKKSIDLNEKQMRDNFKSKGRCEYCQEEEASKKCTECKIFFCERCATGHLRMPSSKQHHMILAMDVMQENKKKLEASISQLQKTAKYYQDARDDWRAIRSDNENKSAAIQNQIIRMEEIILTRVKKLQDRLRSELHRALVKEQEMADALLKKSEGVLEKFEFDICYLKKFTESQELETLTDTGKCDMLVRQAEKRCAALNTTPLPRPFYDTILAITWPKHELSNVFRNIKLIATNIDRKSQLPTQSRILESDIFTTLLDQVAKESYESTTLGIEESL